MLAKQLEYLGGAASAGIVLGARVPIVLTSRADPRESRIASCAVALVAARRLAQPDAMAPGVRKDSAADVRCGCAATRGPGVATVSAADGLNPLGPAASRVKEA